MAVLAGFADTGLLAISSSPLSLFRVTYLATTLLFKGCPGCRVTGAPRAVGVSQSEPVEEGLEDIAADLSFRIAQLYHWLSNQLGQDNVAFLVQHSLVLVGELSLYNKLLADKCSREDSVTIAKEALNALAKAVAVTLDLDQETQQVLEADGLILRAQAVLYHRARACLGLD